MIINLYSCQIKNIKFLKNFFVIYKNNFFSLFFNKKFFFFKKKIYLYSFFKKDNYKLFFLNNFYTFLFNFFKGICFKFTLEARRFKFLLNKNFLFFKLDTSHFNVYKFFNNFFLKKLQKNKKLFFYSFNFKFLKSTLLDIQKFKKSNKYKKKGFFLNKV